MRGRGGGRGEVGRAGDTSDHETRAGGAADFPPSKSSACDPGQHLKRCWSLRQTLLSLGNVVYGRTSDPRAAADLVTRYYPYDPHWVRKHVPHHTMLTDRGRVLGSALVDVQTVEYTLEEQIALWSRAFLTLPTFEFLVGASAREGTLLTELVRLTIRNLDRGVFVNEALTRAVRSRLMGRDGVAMAELLAEIAARTRQFPVPQLPVPQRDDRAERALPAGGRREAAPQRPAAPPTARIGRHHLDEV